MLYVKFTINDVVIDNSKLLESIKFSTTTTNTYSVGTFYYTITTIKLDNSVDIKTGDVVKFYLSEDNTTWIDYGIYEPYSIKKQTLYREVTLYSMPSLKLLEKYVPNQTDYNTRTLLTEMQLNLNIVIEDFDSILAIDMQGVKSDAGMTILSQVAMLLGCNVLITRNGTIRFVDANYNNNTEHTVTTSNITEMVKYDSYPYQITRVLGKLSSDVENPIIVGTQANSWNDLTIENPYLTVGICNSILGTLSPCVFNGYKLKVFNVPISMNVLDAISFTVDGETVKMPITNLEIVYSVGGLVANIDVPLSNSTNNTSAFKGSISTRLDVIKNIQSELNTKVEIVDGNVSSLISRTDVIEGDITTINEQYSQINQTIGEIDLRVGEVQIELGEKVSTDEIISSINLSQEGVKIQGDKLELTGDTIIISDGNNMTLEEYLNQEELTSNLLTQPTFNNGMGTWQVSVSVYIKKDATHVREVDGVTSEAVKFNYTGTSNALALWTNDWTVDKLTANTKYTAKAHVYFEDTSTLTGDMTLRIYGNVDGTLTLISEKAFTSTDFVANEWNEISMEFTTTQDYDNPRYQITCSKGCVAWVTDCAVHGVKSLTQEELVEILNGSGDGFYLIDNKLYINADYIQTGTLRADLIKVNVDGATKNLLPFNYITMDSAINTKFYINEDDNGYPFADCELPIYGGGGSSDFMCVPFGYSDVNIEAGRHYWFSCEYYAVWNNDTKPDDGVGTSTIGNGKYGTKTGNNLDIFLYDGDDISKLNTGRNLLDNTDGRLYATLWSHPNLYQASGFTVSYHQEWSQGLGYTMLTGSGDSTEEYYYRFVFPNEYDLQGLEAGCTYTLSGKVSGTMPTISIRHEWSKGDGWLDNTYYDILLRGEDNWIPFSYTFTIPQDATGFHLGFQSKDQIVKTICYLAHLKLEKSSKATSWCLSPADKGEEIPTYVEESTPLFTLASVKDFNDSVNIVTDSTYGKLERGWTRLVGRIDAEESYTGKLWFNIDCSGFNSGDDGWFYLSKLQLTDAEENDENIELDYIQQIREKHIELTDGSYYTGIYSVDGIDLTEGTIQGTSDTENRKFTINYDGFRLSTNIGTEYSFVGESKSYYSYNAGSSGTIDGYDYIYGAGASKTIGGNREGIFIGVHEGFQVPNSTEYGRADIYSYKKYDDITGMDDWTDWELLGQKIEPQGLVRRDDYANVTTQTCLCIAQSTGTSGTTYNGATVFSEAMYNAVGNGQLINVNPSDNRIYVGNPNSILLLESAYGLTVNEAGTQKQVLTNGTQYGHPQVNIYTGSNIEIWADCDKSSNEEYVWIGAGANAITIKSDYGALSPSSFRYNGNTVLHQGNIYKTRENAQTGRDIDTDLTKICSYNLYNKALLNGDGTSSAYGGYWSVLQWGCGASGSAQLAIDWTSQGKGIYMRSLRDTEDNWWRWKRIGNSDWILDSTSDERYKRAISDVSTEDCYNMVRNIELHSYLLLTEEERYLAEKGELDVDELFLQTVTSEGIHHNLQMGVLAQDMLKYSCGTYVVNQDVLRDENGELISDRYGIDAYNYASAILGGLQEEIKIRDKQYEELKQENEELKAKNQELEERLARIEKLLLGE